MYKKKQKYKMITSERFKIVFIDFIEVVKDSIDDEEFEKLLEKSKNYIIMLKSDFVVKNFIECTNEYWDHMYHQSMNEFKKIILRQIIGVVDEKYIDKGTKLFNKLFDDEDMKNVIKDYTRALINISLKYINELNFKTNIVINLKEFSNKIKA